MGVFINYEPLPYANLSNGQTTLIGTDSINYPHTLIINGICLTNLGNQSIRFNLKKNRVQTTPVSIFKVKEFEVKAYQTIDVIGYFNMQLILKYSNTSPIVTENLVCFSNSPSQLFDCEITFSVLNETPLNF